MHGTYSIYDVPYCSAWNDFLFVNMFCTWMKTDGDLNTLAAGQHPSMDGMLKQRCCGVCSDGDIMIVSTNTIRMIIRLQPLWSPCRATRSLSFCLVLRAIGAADGGSAGRRNWWHLLFGVLNTRADADGGMALLRHNKPYIFLNWCVSRDPKLSIPLVRNCDSVECLVAGRSFLFGACVCVCRVRVGLAV